MKDFIKENNVIVEYIYGLKSLDKFNLLDDYTIYNFIDPVPEDGSIKFSPHNTFQLGLDPKFEYLVSFYDKNFMIMSMNPGIVRRNALNIKKGVFPFIYLRVNYV